MAEHEELEKIHEQAEQARDRFDKTVAGTMAIVAALLAIVTVLGQHYNTEQLLLQERATDQWAYAQAKDIRHYVAQATRDLLLQTHAAGDLTGRYGNDSVRYKQDQSQILEEAKKLENERDMSAGKAYKFHFGEIFLEISLVLFSLSILTKRRLLAFMAAFAAVVGTGWGLTGFLR